MVIRESWWCSLVGKYLNSFIEQSTGVVNAAGMVEPAVSVFSFFL